MVVVNSADGIKYGFRLMGYLFGVAIISLILGLVLGGVVGGVVGAGSEGGLVIGGIFALMGMQAGSLGLGYKVIADGVYTGVNATETR